MANGTRNGLLVGSLVLAGGLLVLLVAGGVLGQAGMWSPNAMQGGMGSGMMGNVMMNGMNGGMGNMDHEAMHAQHAQCQEHEAHGNMTMPT